REKWRSFCPSGEATVETTAVYTAAQSPHRPLGFTAEMLPKRLTVGGFRLTAILWLPPVF
ncbi:MAG: hypothetical protein ACO4AI_12025, partial [Prochlorothrix sp.]